MRLYLLRNLQFANGLFEFTASCCPEGTLEGLNPLPEVHMY
jgi:hypothetical protein